MQKIVAALAALALSACAAQSGVVDTGGGTYFVSRQAATGFEGMGNLRAEALRDASTQCGQRRVVVTEEHQTQPPYLLGNFPRIDLTFRCE